MKPPLRVLIAATSLLLSVGACFATDSSTGMGGGDGSSELAVQPALIPSPADDGALPINRIRAVATRVSDDAVVGQTVLDVSPTAPSWTVDLSVTRSEGETAVVVFIYLINVEGGVESIQFSGRSDPILLVEGEIVTPDIPVVRGPLANLLVTGVTITTAPATMVVGGSQSLAATVGTSEPADPEVFWTSLDPGVVTVEGSTVTAVGPGIGEVAASAGAFSDVVEITVHGPLTLTTSTLPSVTVDQDYDATLTAAGGDGSYSWAVTVGSLPPQLSLNPTTGQITGAATNVGSSTFTVTVTSGDGQTASRQLTITVYDVLVVTTSFLPPGPQNVPYDESLAATGGDGAYTWSLAAGALPPGLDIDGGTGAITGVPSDQGVFGFTAMVASGDGQTAQRALSIEIIEAGFGQIVGVVYDAVTSQVIQSATLSLSGEVQQQTISDANGEYQFAAVPGGTYSVVAVADGYVDNTAANLEVVDVSGDVVRADFALPPTGSLQRFGGLSGRVLNEDLEPMAGASVSISGGAQTNGIFRSTTTDADGTYALVGIVLDDTQGEPIAGFTVLASASGYATAQTTVPLVENETVPNVDFQLTPSQGGTVFLQDGFEQDTGWEFDGFWNRSTLDGITNTAVPTYVSLAPGDNSGGALPAPIGGSYAFWYGEAASGNFLGVQSQGDFEGSGGTGETYNFGTLASPILIIPPNTPQASLRFDTWFEIESVNPNELGYDLMTIAVYDVNQDILTELGRLNPFVDPTFTPRDAIPFTSGGFNAPPVWRSAYVDLTQYAGIDIQIVFIFDTIDNLYNGFRGWIIDNVVVSDEPVPVGAPTPAPPRDGPTTPRGSR